MFTHGFELTTALTNVIIFIVSLFCFFKTKDRGLWKFFFLTIIIDSFIGSIVHGIVMSESLINALWFILAFFFTLTINTIFCIFLKGSYFHIFILSILLSGLMFAQMIFDMDFLLTFTMYALLILGICTVYILKDKMIGFRYILLGFLFQVFGGLLMLWRVKFFVVDHNGLYHLFMVLTLICLYIGVNKKYKVC